MPAFPASLVPNFFPMKTPAKHTQNVTPPMMSASESASGAESSAIVKPTESASMDVATPCRSSAAIPVAFFSLISLSAPPRIPSTSIFPPMKSSRTSAIHGIAGRNAANASAMLWTQYQPMRGIAVWNRAKTRAMPAALRVFIAGSLSPFAIETEKASIASPRPNPAALRKKNISIGCSP